MNLQFFDDLWIRHQPDRSGMAEFWDRRAESFNQHKRNEKSRKYRSQLIDGLVARAQVTPESAVLDVGCGPGQHALLLSYFAAEVCACDIAPKMIDYARENAITEGRSNLHFEVLDWATADIDAKKWQKKFQFVLASKTPAVNDLATLRKMMAVCNGYCCLISQVDTENSIRDQLKPLVDWNEETARISRTFYCAFNLLWLLGYYPEVSYIDKTWESDIELEDAQLIYERYFASIGALKPDQKKLMTNALAELAVDGKIREQVKSKTVIIFWKV